MILVLLALSAIAFFISFIYIEKISPRLICTIISGLLVFVSLGAIVGNFYSHWGMHQVSQTSSKQIYSADTSGKMKMILYQDIGTSGKRNVFIYNAQPDAKKVSHTQGNEYTKNNVVRSNRKTAIMRTTEKRWKYKSSWGSFWFGIAGNNSELISRQNKFFLPKTWFKLSTVQVKELKATLSSKAFKAQAQKKAAVYVETKLKEAIAEDPAIATDKAKQNQLIKQFTAEFQANLIKETVSEIKKK
ncbi:DUF4811 domain-containing protein [Liquorilactobacillus oeni]|uniref:DUF4811 domain-containing protein n=1 Tax=Liquorilactobacillus oeni DSM 19972 TaxID=1423777 RepID=A0A0R1M8R3_9LACO|nr:DUF4811 domain-containing protein [Liquorilactobacillus oeni]KRL04576.1 hypothetical protein FD46_GL001708 [Liquorilactobacillus oeni DSM 19972]